MDASSDTVAFRWHYSKRAGLAFLLVLVFLRALIYSYYFIFTRPVSVDEGYLMLSVKGFMEGHPLYDQVFTQYGPVYYFYEWLIRKATGVPLTHDSTRLLCIGHWLGAACFLGLTVAFLRRSVLLGAFAFMQGVAHLSSLANEPGHPQEVVAVLLALAALVTAIPKPFQSVTQALAEARPWLSLGNLRLNALAIIGALLLFIKVNVGAFYLMALLVALLCQTAGPAKRFRFILLIAGSALAPFILMRSHLSEPWCRKYALINSIGLAGMLCVALASRSPPAFSLSRQLKAGLCLIVTCCLLLGLTLWAGSSFEGLLEGLILVPLKMPAVALLPMILPDGVLLNAGVALLAALVASRCPVGSRWNGLLVWLKGIYGLTGCVLLTSDAQGQLAWLLPWAWLALAPISPRLGQPENFSRVFLTMAAGWQGLQAYPIAGTQVSLATLLLVVLCTVCLADAIQGLEVWPPLREHLQLFEPRTMQMGRVLGIIGMIYLFTNHWCQPAVWHRSYASLTPLELPGSERIHQPAETVGVYRELMQYLQSNCDTFITYPGYNSFYFWTDKRPPTQFNGTGWGQLSQSQRDQILQSLSQHALPLVVVHEYMVQGWKQQIPEPVWTLAQYLQQRCREVTRIGPFIVYAPRPAEVVARRGAQ